MAGDTYRRQATLAGVPLKHISLITLTFQNSALTLIMHYSRVMPPVNGHRYYTSTAVFLNEVLKLTLSLSVALYEIASNPKTQDSSTATSLFSELVRSVFHGDSWKMAVPALLYTLQNSLQYVAVSNLDAATFQVTYQLKILTTAIFSVTMLGRTLGMRKWLSLVLLMMGVGIVSIPNASSGPHALSRKDLFSGAAFHTPRSIWDLEELESKVAGRLLKRSATYEGIDEDVKAVYGDIYRSEFNSSIGLFAVIAACILSGLAGVYFEKILKDPKGNSHNTSLWIRNVQLSFYSLWPALFIGVLFKDGEHIAKTGFFSGYNWIVWSAISFQAAGGVLVSLVVNYADNIAKNFATSISILVSFLASVILFDFQITPLYLLGIVVVLAATYLYNSPSDGATLRPPPINVSTHEKHDEDDRGYFDLDSVTSGPGKSPSLRAQDAMTTSRPGTPSFERRARSKQKS